MVTQAVATPSSSAIQHSTAPKQTTRDDDIAQEASKNNATRPRKTGVRVESSSKPETQGNLQAEVVKATSTPGTRVQSCSKLERNQGESIAEVVGFTLNTNPHDPGD